MMSASGCALGSFAGLRITGWTCMDGRTQTGFRLVLGLRMTEGPDGDVSEYEPATSISSKALGAILSGYPRGRGR